MKTLKNLPRLKLVDLLRRRKTTLARLLEEFGITTYEGLCVWCHRMGVLAPDEQTFTEAFPRSREVNNPQEGMVVLEPMPIIEENTGRVLSEDEIAEETMGMNEPWSPVVDDVPEKAPKRPRKKKAEPVTD